MGQKTLRRGRDRLLGGPHIEGFIEWLRCQGYAECSVQNVLGYLGRWADWAASRGFNINTIESALVASERVVKTEGRRRFGAIHKKSVGAGRLYVRHLRACGIVHPAPAPLSPAQRWPRLREFRCWMRQHRGLMESTLDLWQRHIVQLLESLGDDADRYSAQAVRAFVLERAKAGGRARARTIASAVRAYLRFLAAHSRCPSGLEYAVPRVAQWQLSTVPKYLLANELDRLLDACRGPGRLRDKAIILLLARLGLRSSEVAALRLDEIDWVNARIPVSGKSRRAQWLPLTQEIGDAILAYLKIPRARKSSESLFMTNRAPRRAITRITVKCVVRQALIRAGIDSPSKGAHVLRHTAATSMLGSGVSLAGVGAVLRHRSSLTTLLYAKVDLPKLASIAQPWVGRLPC